MTFAESADLINNRDFQGRVKVAALKYAGHVFAQPNQSNSRTSWAQRMLQSPDQMAQGLVPAVVMNVNVQTYGKDIDDPNLEAAVTATAEMLI